jgi:hypothetical protein
MLLLYNKNELALPLPTTQNNDIENESNNNFEENNKNESGKKFMLKYSGSTYTFKNCSSEGNNHIQKSFSPNKL